MKILLLFWLSIIGVFELKAQNPLYDSIFAAHGRSEYPFIIIPAYYDSIAQHLNFAENDKTDSFSLRLWSSHMFGYELILIAKRKDSWNIHKYTYKSNPSLTEVSFTSQISASDFFSTLQKTDLKTLISQSEIKDFKDNVDDGITYTMEIIANGSYKVFQYHSPESNSDKEGYHKRFNGLIKLVDKFVH